MDVPETGVAPLQQKEPTITMVISTYMGWDKKMGTVYVSTMTASMEIMVLEAPSMVVGCQGATEEELAKKRLGRGLPLTAVISCFSPG